ncbi:uncharacterized protein V6R79_010702 [Siganus canaliculatus]
MRTGSALYHCCRPMFHLTWFGYGFLSAVCRWLWRRITAIWRNQVVAIDRAKPEHGALEEDQSPRPQTRPADFSDSEDVDDVEEGSSGYHTNSEGPLPVQPENDDDECVGDSYRVETTDELFCVYDSTWETEENQDRVYSQPLRPAQPRSYKFSRFQNAAKDMQNYRHNYPSQMNLYRWSRVASVDDNCNLKFYSGLEPSKPDGIYIDTFHTEWFGEYDRLEYVHTYVQWLFPLQEPGMNDDASPLTKEEMKCFLKDSKAMANLVKSYKLMLDFYGVELYDEIKGTVRRTSNWTDRFNNLNNNTHNNLRITRILKCLGHLGYAHYQAPLVRFFLEETLVHGQLPNVKDSVLNYFVFAVLNRSQRRNLLKFAYLHYDWKDEFVWCPKKIQKIWSRTSRNEKVWTL